MSYILPQDVTAPRELWETHRVIIEGTEGQPAYALGTWDKGRTIGTRWNGRSDNEAGFPRAVVHPCWHILDPKLHDGVIALLPDYSEKIRALRFLNNEDV
jgi:hypothetical protein